jgi:Uma2 family endonuclease
VPVDAPVTADELLALPVHGVRYELIRGELRAISPPGFQHGLVSLRIAQLLAEHAGASGCGVAVGEAGFVLETSPDTVRAPDAAFIARQRADAVGVIPGYWPGAPDLAVEVLSPSDDPDEVRARALAWLEAGTTAVLVIDPRGQTATVHRTTGETTHATLDTIDLSDPVPGFSLHLSSVLS